MEVNLLTTEYLRDPLIEIVRITLPGVKINALGFGARALSQDILSVDCWIIDAFESASNPSGFRTANKMAGKIKCLLLFVWLPPNFPWQGPFWCHLLSRNFEHKLKELDKLLVPSESDFQKLMKLWPILGVEPTISHHHG